MARRSSGKRKKGRCIRRAKIGQLGGGMVSAMEQHKGGDLSDAQNKKYAKRIGARLERRLDRIDEKMESSTAQMEKVPKTFVLHRGIVGRNVQRLVKDVRVCFEPNTAVNLKAMRRNKLRDFISISRPLGVSHMVIMTKSDVSVNMRLCKLPQGPTLTFQVVSYTLCRDVCASQKRPISYDRHLQSAPLLVMNEFGGSGSLDQSRNLRLTQSIMQNMFPQLKVDVVNQNNIKRCILLNHDSATDTIEFRHYIVRTSRGDNLSRNIRKIAPDGQVRSVKVNRSRRLAIPDLSKYSDISDFILKPEPGQSDSEMSDWEEANVVEMVNDGKPLIKEEVKPSDSGKNQNPQMSRVKLIEIGPRMTLRLVKIEEGTCEKGGQVLYHAFEQMKDTQRKEFKEKKKMAVEGARIRRERRDAQEENVKKKQRLKEEHKKQCELGTMKKFGEEKKRKELSVKKSEEKQEEKQVEEPVKKKRRISRENGA